MEGIYPIYWDEKTIGQVQISRKGLYYLFVCKCSFTESCVCRLMIRCGTKTERIGILVPEGDAFVLKKQIPIKNFHSEKPVFYILCDIPGDKKGLFVPVTPKEPFRYLSKLQNAVFANQEGIQGVWIPDIT